MAVGRLPIMGQGKRLASGLDSAFETSRLAMLRIHFTADDLARTRLTNAPDPMWEIALSLHRLSNRDSTPGFDRWRRQARQRLGPAARLLIPLNPPVGYFPDFLTPAEGAAGLDQGVEAVLTTPRARLREELRILAAQRPLPSWTRSLADGEPETMTRLGWALRSYYDSTIAPAWPTVQTHVDADRRLRVGAFLDGGCEGILASLRPLVRWHPPVLEVNYPVRQHLHLDGRGLRLVPSFFCWHTPVTLLDPDLPPVLVYPVQHHIPFSYDGTGAAMDSMRSLGALLGHTRAAILRALEMTSTTTQLAGRVHVSPGAVSQHTAVLRDAGLIHTRRHGSSVFHTLTPLGIALLDGRVPMNKNAPGDISKQA
jgi:DNA-binding transcriptional ArsR family regulator